MSERYCGTLEEVKGDTEWSDAEEKVIAQAWTSTVELGGAVPTGPAPGVTVRGALIRHLVMGGCDALRVPEKGVLIVGAWVRGLLDLEGCASERDLRLSRCGFAVTPMLQDARLGAVYLPGCHVPGLDLHRLKVTRDVLLDKGFRADGLVDLVGAEIGSVLQCSGGKFLAEGVALDANAATIGADVFLRDGFEAKGTVVLRGARIVGQLDCSGGKFLAKGVALTADAASIEADVFLRDGFEAKGLVNLIRAEIKGHLICHKGRFDGGIDGAGMQVKGGWFWEDVASVSKVIDLTDAEVGRLHDDAASWAGAEVLKLSGFRYARLSGDLTIAQRLAWLGRKAERTIEPAVGWGVPFAHGGRTWRVPLPWVKGAYKDQCDPQPYTQLATVLRAQGVTQGAARVLEARDWRVRVASYHRARCGLDGTWSAGWASIWTPVMMPVYGLFGLFFGHGHRPGRALWLVVAIWFACFQLYGKVYATGQMAPNSDVVLTSADWTWAIHEGCPKVGEKEYAARMATGCEMPLAIWNEKAKAAPDYETFSAGLYALDLFVPLDALGQENAWAPSKERGFWGWLGYWARMPVQMAGWIITAVAAAALTGLVGRKD